jgi:hypothetical protein
MEEVPDCSDNTFITVLRIVNQVVYRDFIHIDDIASLLDDKKPIGTLKLKISCMNIGDDNKYVALGRYSGYGRSYNNTFRRMARWLDKVKPYINDEEVSEIIIAKLSADSNYISIKAVDYPVNALKNRLSQAAKDWMLAGIIEQEQANDAIAEANVVARIPGEIEVNSDDE